MTKQSGLVWVSTLALALSLGGAAQARSYHHAHHNEQNLPQQSTTKTESKTVKSKDGSVIHVSPSHRKVSRIIKLRSFSRLETNDAIDVEVIAGSRQRMIRLIGYEQDVNHVSVNLTGKCLKVAQKHRAQFKGHVLAIIHTGQLTDITHNGTGKFTLIGARGPMNSLNVNADGFTKVSGRSIALHELNSNGRGMVKVTGLYANSLAIKGEGSNLIELRGRLGVSNIDLSGGKLSGYWIDSRHMNVRATGNAVVQLAGRVKLFEANIYGTAHLNARYLRARRVFVKTYDKALAELQVTESQNTLASDNSNIYYYKNAKFQGDFMARSGAVLNMNGMS